MGTPITEERLKLSAPPRTEKELPPPRRRSRAWIWLLVLAALGYAGWHYRGVFASGSASSTPGTSGGRGGGGGTVPVGVATATRGDIPVYLRGIGTVAPFNTVTVHSRVDGQLLRVDYTEGQLVHQGEVLAELDPRPFQVQLEQAEGQLAHDTAQLNNAKVDAIRYTNLFKEGVISEQQAATQQALVNTLQGQIATDQGPIDNAKLNLVYCKVTAPITGRIGLRLVDAGNIVHASDAGGLAVIAQLQPISVLFSLPEKDLLAVNSKLRIGGHPVVDAYDADNKVKLASGTLATIDNVIDSSTATYKLKAVFNNDDNKLFPGQFVYMRLLVDHMTGLTIMPAAAIQRGPQGTYVYLVTQTRTVTVRPVTVAITEGDLVGTTSGLNPGDVVVTDGQDKLQEGAKVDAHKDSSGSPASPSAPGTSSAPAQSGSRGAPPAGKNRKP